MCVTVDLIDSSLKSTALSSLFHETNVRELSICSSLKSLSSCERLSKLDRFVYRGVRNSHNLIDLCIEVWETHSPLTSSSLTSLWRCERLSHNSNYCAESFAGSNLARTDPAKEPRIEPRNIGGTPQRWAQVNSAQSGDLGTGLWEATWLSKRTFEERYLTSHICYLLSDICYLLSDIRHQTSAIWHLTSDISQPCAHISLLSRVDLCHLCGLPPVLRGFFRHLLRGQSSQSLTPQKTRHNKSSRLWGPSQIQRVSLKIDSSHKSIQKVSKKLWEMPHR